jgi:protoporphyrinogen/coproporphyrinogen III oxidase
MVKKSSAAARNRFIWTHDKTALSNLSSNPFKTVLALLALCPDLKYSLLKEFTVPASKQVDESLGSFLRRRLGNDLVDRALSGVIHGIYAGDIDALSVRAVMPMLWDMEQKHGSITRAVFSLFFNSAAAPTTDMPLTERDRFVQQVQKNCSIYSFQKGMQQLVDALVSHLKSLTNVTFVHEACTSLVPHPHHVIK